MQSIAKMTKRATLTSEERDQVQRLLDSRGERAVIDLLDVSRSTLSRCLAGMTMQRGTVALIRQRLGGLT